MSRCSAVVRAPHEGHETVKSIGVPLIRNAIYSSPFLQHESALRTKSYSTNQRLRTLEPVMHAIQIFDDTPDFLDGECALGLWRPALDLHLQLGT